MTVYVLWIDLYTFHWKMKIKEKASWIKLSTQHSSDQQWLSEANCERDFDQARSCVTFTIWCWYFCIFLGHRWIETIHAVFLSLMSTNQFLAMILSQSAGNRVLRHLTWDGLQSNPNGTLQRQDWRGIIYFCSFSLLRSKAWAWMSTSLSVWSLIYFAVLDRTAKMSTPFVLLTWWVVVNVIINLSSNYLQLC